MTCVILESIKRKYLLYAHEKWYPRTLKCLLRMCACTGESHSDNIRLCSWKSVKIKSETFSNVFRDSLGFMVYRHATLSTSDRRQNWFWNTFKKIHWNRNCSLWRIFRDMERHEDVFVLFWSTKWLRMSRGLCRQQGSKFLIIIIILLIHIIEIVTI